MEYQVGDRVFLTPEFYQKFKHWQIFDQSYEIVEKKLIGGPYLHSFYPTEQLIIYTLKDLCVVDIISIDQIRTNRAIKLNHFFNFYSVS